MAEEKKIATGYIGNALRSAADNHTTTFADEIFDTERQKYQNEVNTDLDNTDNEIKADLEAETARATAAEQANATAIEAEKTAIIGTDRIADGAVTLDKIAHESVDDEPTAGSNNLVNSGGVANKLAELEQKTSEGKQDVIPQVSQEETEQSDDEQVFASDDYDEEKGTGEVYAAISKYGIKVKELIDLDGNRLVKHGVQKKMYGTNIHASSLKDINSVEVFGEVNVSSANNQLLNDSTTKSVTLNGATASIDENGFFNLSGRTTTTSALQIVGLPITPGIYTLSLHEVSNPNNLDWHCSAMIRMSVGGDKKIGVNKKNLTFTVPEGETSVVFGFYIGGEITLDGTKLKVMVNEGNAPKEYERYVSERIVNFPIDTLEIHLNEHIKHVTLSSPLRAYEIPVYSGWNRSGSTERTRFTTKDEFTYANDKGSIFVADSIKIDGSVVKKITRVGSFVYGQSSSPVELLVATDGKPINFLSSNIDGLVNGASIYYRLAEETEEIIGVFQYDVCDTMELSNDKDAYMYLDYEILEYNDNEVAIKEISSFTDTNILSTRALWGFEKSGNMLYASGFPIMSEQVIPVYKFSVNDGVISFVKKANLTNTRNKATCIRVNGDYLYVITHSQVPANNPDTYGEEGNLFILDNELNVITRTSLLWKGCDAQIFKSYLYVMEQMGRFEVFDITNTTNPVRVYGFDGAKMKEYLSDGTENSIPYTLREHQHATCFSIRGKDYMSCGGFASGIHLYDISNPERPVFKGSFQMNKRSDKDNGMYQSFTAHYDFPYIYATIAKSTAKVRFAHNAVDGIVVLPADENVFTDSTFPSSHKDDYFVANIPEEYRSTGRAEGDSHPSRMAIGEDFAFVNNGRYVVVYRIMNHIPVYAGVINLGSLSADGLIYDGQYLYLSSGMASSGIFIKSYKIK